MNEHSLSSRWYVLCAVAVASLACACSLAGAEPVTLTAFDQPLTFAYGEWQGKVAVQDGRLPIHGVNGKGGGGLVKLQDLTPYAGRMLALRLRVGPGNAAKGIMVLLADKSQNVARWEFALPAPGADPVTLLPVNGGTLAEPDGRSQGGPFSLAQIVNWQVGGDYTDKAVDVEVEQVLLLAEADDARVAAAREAHRAKIEADRKKAEEALAAARASVKHTPASPWVERCYAVAPDVLAVSIRAREIVPGHIEPYVAQAGDEVRPKDHRADLYRNGRFVAKVIGPKLDTLVFEDQIRGDALVELLAGRTETWSLSSGDDPNYREAVAPTAVGRKSKPMNWQKGGWGPGSFAMRHILYLKLPKPLVEGATYSLDCSRINLRDTAHEFKYAPRSTWSEAVHDCQIGFRPDDPVKRGFVSVWLGTGGVQHYADGLGFAVLDDASGKEAFRGKLEMSRRADQTEDMPGGKETRNWNYTDVLRADFSSLKAPGTYRLYVDGVGCSYPFRIANDVWEKAFLVQMQGFYNQRGGIELGPPYTEYRRPRDFNPADGLKVIQSSHSVLDEGNEWELAKHATGEIVPDAWGGYEDAGDWNPRRMTHMRNNTDLLLELLRLKPEYFGKISWPLPDQQPVPSLLKEIMFEVDCFRRLQLPNGACRFGLETEGDPRDAEVSWKQTMDLYAYAPDPWSSYLYASIAARLAGVLEGYDKKLAEVYKESALRAMQWAEGEWPKLRDTDVVTKHWEMPDDRNLAALELYRLTRDPHWHDVFMDGTVLKDPEPALDWWGKHIQLHAAFAYATLPEGLGDPALKAKARAGTIGFAEAALKYADGNAWNLTSGDKWRPLFGFFYSVPLAVDLVRAHYLTGDNKYLAGIVQACLFPGGANPMNATFTVGVGADWPHNPLKVDARITGQTTPLGQTVFGPVDYLHWQDGFHVWPMNSLLKDVTTPGPYEWPVPESFYDIWIYVAQDEYTVEGFGQNAYVWGYLASRSAVAP